MNEETAGARVSDKRTRLGRGRSGEVWLVGKSNGKHAEKIFYGDTLSNLIHYATIGAPNPYIWNEHAVRAAFERRQILADLFPFWFGHELDIARALDVAWNEEDRVFTLTTEYVSGPFVPLRHPFRPFDERMPRLAWHLMPSLQARLEEAGFDGLVWQAGRGNPVALNNFLMSGTETKRYVLIDAESGVPAIFVPSVRTFFGYYLPKAIRYRRVLFDDVDTEKLADYVRRKERDLRPLLGDDGWERLHERIACLAAHQKAWKETSRMEKAIAYQVVKGRLSREKAGFFQEHPLRWRLREASRALGKIARLLAIKVPLSAGRLLRKIDLGAAVARFKCFLTSQDYRTQLGESYVRGRIEDWRSRRQLEDADAQQLLADLQRTRETSSYVTDFGSHLGMKASFLMLELVVLGGLSLLGVPLLVLALIFAIDGPIYRTLYTLYRSTFSVARRQAPPWIALIVGLVPLLGSLAYPAQMLWSAEQDRNHLAQFIVYDTFTRIGARISLLGGKDTLTEHAFNRFAAWLVGHTERRVAAG